MSNNRSYRYFVYLLFVLSGVAGLVYQIVWTRMLVLVFGNTMLATSTVLSAFMGGLAAGSYVVGKHIDKKPRALLSLYGLLEGGIGLFALIFPFLLDLVTPVYSGMYSVVEGNIVLLNLFRFVICFILIGLPTFLMGGTLPVLIKRFTQTDDSIGYETGFLYGLNTVGAVVGTFACGYFMLRLLGMQQTTWVAVAINLAVAVVAWYLGKRPVEAPKPVPAEMPKPVATESSPTHSPLTIKMVMIGIGLSGFCALAYEVFWTRMLNLFVHNNIYSFTAILATFLIGIAVGSLFYAKFLSKLKRQIGLFIWLEIGIALISYFTPYIFRIFHGSLFNNFNEALTLAKAGVIMIAPTIMMGIAVPLAIQICRRGLNKEGTSVGTVYAANTVGSILGAFAAGFILLPTVGLHYGIIIVASLNVVAGFLPLIAKAEMKRRLVWSALFVVFILALVLPVPSQLFKGLFQEAHPNADIIHYKEGKVANVLVYDFKKLGYKDFHLNAVNEASSRIWHVQLFKMLGLLPTVIHDNPTDALMVAFGAGMSAGATASNVESLDCVDLNPDIQGIAAAFTRENLDVINKPNFHQIVNDGRNALLLNDKKYSLIISDATNPKMFDSWTLYSQEFYQIVKDRLEPDGIFCQWALIPLPQDALKVILNTFRSVFPHMSFWVIHGSSQVLMLGTPERLEFDYEELKTRLEPLYEKAGLGDYGVNSVEKFLSFFILGEDGLEKFLDGYDKISTDDMPHAQFHIEQDASGIDQSLDLVRYQESIIPYMKNPDSLPDDFKKKMDVYADIARRLNIGFLINQSVKFSEADVVADNAGMYDANVAYHLNHGPEKKRYFKERVAEYPDDYTSYNWLGNIHLLDYEFTEAKAAFNRVLELKPDYAFALMNLALTDIQLGNYDDAVQKLLTVREMRPTKRIMSSVELQLKKIRLLRKLQYEPGSTDLNLQLARVYYQEGQLLRAVKGYRKAVALSDNSEEIVFEFARVCDRHGFVDDAAKMFNLLAKIKADDQMITAVNQQYDYIRTDTTGYRNWYNTQFVPTFTEDEMTSETTGHPPTCDQALALWNDMDPEGSADTAILRQAAKLYEESFAAKPDDLHAYVDAALLYEFIGDYDRAIYLWEQAYNVRTEQAFMVNANRIKALAELNRVSISDDKKVTVLNDLGNIYLQINEPEQAIAFLKQAVALAPKQTFSWLALSKASLKAGMYSEAVTAADKALSLEPNLIEAKLIQDQLKQYLN